MANRFERDTKFLVHTDELYVGMTCDIYHWGEYDNSYIEEIVTEDKLKNIISTNQFRDHYLTKEEVTEELKDQYNLKETKSSYRDTITFFESDLHHVYVSIDLVDYMITVQEDLRQGQRERPMIYFGKCRSLNSLKRLRKQYNF